MQTKHAYLVLGIFAAASAYLAWLSGWQKSLTGIAVFAIAIGVVVATAMAVLGAGAITDRVRQTLFPPPALWEKPRRASSIQDEVLVTRLTPRLDLQAQAERVAFWKDRHTGQNWKSVAYDFEFTEDIVYEPVTGDIAGNNNR